MEHHLMGNWGGTYVACGAQFLTLGMFLCLEFFIGICDVRILLDMMSPNIYKCYISPHASQNSSHMKGLKWLLKIHEFEPLCFWPNFWMLKYKGVFEKSIVSENFKNFQTEIPWIPIKEQAEVV